MGLDFKLQLGTSRQIQVQCLNPDDSVPTGQFLSSDAVGASIWQGSQLTPLLTKASGSSADVGWIDATNAQWFLTLHPTDTSTWSPGVYYLEATAARGSDTAALLPDGTTLTLTSAPGTATVRPTYIAASDLRRIASWIDGVQAPGSETGFAEQMADARSWLDENILRNYPGGYVSLLGEHGTALAAFATSGAQRSSIRNPWILQLLAQGPAVANTTGGLIVTQRTKDVCAFYALHRICDGMITKGNQYAALSARYRMEAYQLLTCYTAELSVAGAVDQWGQLIAMIPINFGSARPLRV